MQIVGRNNTVQTEINNMLEETIISLRRGRTCTKQRGSRICSDI